MKKILYFLITLFLFSCSTSSEVVSHNLIQKRKYNKGYFYKKHQNSKTEFHNSNNSDSIIFKPSISNLLLIKISSISLIIRGIFFSSL